MRRRLVLTEENFHLYAGEYDAVTHAPYRLGDVLCRCERCGGLVREDYTRGGRCPLCGEVFRGAGFRRHTAVRIRPTPARRGRSESAAMKGLAVLLALLAPLPVLIWDGRAAAIFPWLGTGWIVGITLTVSVVCAVMIVPDPDMALLWSRRRQGLMLAVLPLLLPYALWLALWLLIQVMILIWGLLKALLAAVLCIAVFSALFGS